MARLIEELTTTFERGMLDSVAATRFPSDAVALLLNARVQPDGTVQTRAGTQREHAESLGDGVGYGAISFQIPTGESQTLVFVGNKAFLSDDDHATWTEIADELNEGYWDFSMMRVGKDLHVFCANGGPNVYRWDGTVFEPLPNAPAGVKYVEQYNDRLWVSGHNGPIIQASRVADPETWDTNQGALLLQVRTHDGDEITGMYQLGGHLVVFGRNSTSLVNGYGESTLVVAAGSDGISRSVGCLAFRTIVAVGDNAICWLSDRGIEHYAGGEIHLRSQGLQKFFRGIDRRIIEQSPGAPTAAYDPATQEYHLALRTGAVMNDRTVVLNLLNGAMSIDDMSVTLDGLTWILDEGGYLTISSPGQDLTIGHISGYLEFSSGGSDALLFAVDPDDGYLEPATQGNLPSTLFVSSDIDHESMIHSLGYDGFIRRHETGTLDDALSDGTGGAPIRFALLSRPFYLRAHRNRKRIRSVHIATLNEDAATLSVAIRARGIIHGPKSLTVPGRGLDQTTRKKLRFSARGDAPQVDIRTSDQVRIALVGVTGEVLEETR